MAFWDWFRTSWEPITEPVSEAVGMVGYDPDEGHTAEQVGSAYARRLSGAHPTRDLTPMSADKARDTAAGLFISHGLAKRIVDIYRDWIVGTGMTIEVEPEQTDIERRDRKPTRGPDGAPIDHTTPMREAVIAPNDISGPAKKRQRERQEIVDTFWHDPSNNLDTMLHSYVTMLSAFGELLLNVAVNPTNGHVKLGMIDPGSIAAVILDPFACGTPLAVDLKGKGAGDETVRLKCIRIDEKAASATYGRRIGPKPDETYRDAHNKVRTYAGACFIWQLNKIPTAERGNSDLTCVIDYLDSLDQMHWSEMDRSNLAKSVVFDVTVTGASPLEIDKRRADLAANPPKPGSQIVHNEKEIWAVNSPTLNAWDYQALVEVIWNHIAASTGIPKHWIASTVDVNKATATEMAEPTIKTLETRQRFVIEMLQELCSFALDQAELVGRIAKRRAAPGRLPTAWPLKVTAPEIRTRDTATAAKALNDTSTAVAGLITAGVIDDHAAQEVAVSVIDGLGPKIDLESMRERLDATKVQRAEQAATELEQQTDAQIAIKKAAPTPMPGRRAG